MRYTIARLIPRFDKVGFDLVLAGDTEPQAWTVRDRLTGEIEDFGGPAPNGWGDSLHAVRCHLYMTGSRARVIDHRIQWLFEQGKTIGETADMLSLCWDAVFRHRRRLRLPHTEPRGARQAWLKERKGETPKIPSEPTPADWAPFKAIFDQLQDFLPSDIQDLYRACQSNDAETIDRALDAHLALHGEPEQMALAQLEDPLDVAGSERWRKPAGDVDHRRHGTKTAEGLAAYLALHEQWNGRR